MIDPLIKNLKKLIINTKSDVSVDGEDTYKKVSAYVEMMRDIKGRLHSYIFSDSCKVNGSIKQTVLDYFTEVDGVVAKLIGENAKPEQRLERQEKDREQFVNRTMPSLSFAEVAASRSVMNLPIKPKMGDNALIVRSKDNFKGKNSDDVKNSLFAELKDKKGEIRIRAVRKLKDKAVIMEMDSKQDLEQVVECISKSENFSAKVQGKINPRIIVYDVKAEVSEENLINDIIGKNLKDLDNPEVL